MTGHSNRSDLFAVSNTTPPHTLLSLIPAGFPSSLVDLLAPVMLFLPALLKAVSGGAEQQTNTYLPPSMALIVPL